MGISEERHTWPGQYGHACCSVLASVIHLRKSEKCEVVGEWCGCAYCDCPAQGLADCSHPNHIHRFCLGFGVHWIDGILILIHLHTRKSFATAHPKCAHYIVLLYRHLKYQFVRPIMHAIKIWQHKAALSCKEGCMQTFINMLHKVGPLWCFEVTKLVLSIRLATMLMAVY